ncbi:MAG TPA: SRPBCC family protein [Micropepsaceae bacterium]|nr:SRPBCC family protein [Micropepsaceae bacterium]
MEINNSFEVPLPPADAWNVLMDIPRIAPCMPGAELTGMVDKDTYAGKVSVKLGPVALTFAGQVKFTDIDNAAHTARVKAQGKDAKGRGGANANVEFHLEPSALGSRVLVKTDLTLSGMVAQYGRASGMIQDVAQALIGQFADSLKAQLAASQAAPAATATDAAPAAAQPPPPPKPQAISGFALFLLVLKSFFRRLFGGK